MDLVVFAPHRQTCMSASWLSTFGDTMRSNVARMISYVVRGAPYRKLGRRYSRELGGTGISNAPDAASLPVGSTGGLGHDLLSVHREPRLEATVVGCKGVENSDR